jgi:tetratricopeptide (TPR) repeat protein
MLKDYSFRLATVLVLAGLLLSACSSIGGPTPTEVEIVFDPAEALTQTPSTPVPTPTLRPTPTATATLSPTDIPTPTNTLDPYNALIAQGVQQRDAGELDQSIATLSEAVKMDPTNPAAYIQRGITYNVMANPDQALTDFNFAINYAPGR